MNIGDNDIIIFNPNYRIKNDLNRQILYAANSTIDSSYNFSLKWRSTIHPFFGELFNMFDSSLPFGKVCELLCEQFNLSKISMANILSPFVENEEGFYTEYMGAKIKFPKKTLVRLKDGEVCATATVNRPQIEKYEYRDQQVDLSFDRFRKAPDNILFVLTTKCPVNCAYCYCDKKTHYKPLSIERIYHIIDEAYQLGVSYIDTVGGEIFSHPHWDKIVKKLVDMDMSPSYISTKTPVTPRILSQLSQTGYKGVIQFSLDSLSEEILMKTIQAWPNYKKEFIDGVRLLDNHNYRIQVNTRLTSLNCNPDQINMLYSFIQTINNLEYWEIRIANDSLYPQEAWNSIKPTPKDLKDIFSYINDNIALSSHIKLLVSDNALSLPKRCLRMGHRNIEGGICGMLQDRMVILPDGKVTACEELYWHPHYIIGDLNNSSISEIWQSKEVHSLLNPKKESFSGHCSVCDQFSECTNLRNRCPVKTIRAFGKEKYGFPDPRCQFAPPFNTNKYI
ncbi:MAG: radical SAM protein [Bacteroides sp.]|nr:radical SAM protein [Bacteroides sp.]